MILNEDYFKDLELTDEDILSDDTMPDVEEPKYELTLEEAKELPEQYDYCIRIGIQCWDDDRTFIQTILIPRLFKRLDTIFEMYGIEHSEYVLCTSYGSMKRCDTVVKLGNYQLFCRECEKDEFINNTYEHFFIYVFVNYPKFSYKRAFRFLYTMLNLYKNSKLINGMSFNLNTTNDYVIELIFEVKNNHIKFYYYNTKTCGYGTEIYLLSKVLIEKHKREFYRAVFRHFFGEKVNKIDYKAIDRDVPIKPR